MNQVDWLAAASAAIAALSLMANWLVVRRQIRLQQEEIRTAVDAERARWCADVLGAFESAALWLDRANREPAAAEPPLAIAERFSALADLGRLYFPNLDPNRHGAAKAAAFRGHRQPAIDAILLAHDVMRTADRLPASVRGEVSGVLFEARRLLISEVHISADPRRLTALAPGAATSLRSVRKDPTRQIEPLLDRALQAGAGLPSFADRRPE